MLDPKTDIVTDLTDHEGGAWQSIAALLEVLRADPSAVADAVRVSPGYPLASLHLLCPVDEKVFIIGAAENYYAQGAPRIHDGEPTAPFDRAGFFIKSSRSLAGVATPLTLSRYENRQTVHEIELAVVIGKAARSVPESEALDYVGYYTAALDMTLSGPEDRSTRKSSPGYCILGPVLVPAADAAGPTGIALRLSVNGEIRQSGTTGELIRGVAELVSRASEWFELMPGDVILSGTPPGIGPIVAGDLIEGMVEGIGTMRIAAR